MINRCDCGARQGDPHLPACHLADRSDFDADIPAVADAARAMLAALRSTQQQNIDAGVKDIQVDDAIAQAEAAGITSTQAEG